MGVKFTFGGLLVAFMLFALKDVLAINIDHELVNDSNVQIIIAQSDTGENSGSALAIIEEDEEEEPDCD